MTPDMLSTKDLSYLEDIFGWNHIARKQIISFIDMTELKEVKKELEETLKMHTKICESIIEILGGFNEN
ncbi:MAG: hypothetical protein R3Y21_05550 [Mycoplasmatota bacterium]